MSKSEDHQESTGWQRLDRAAFGIIYGAIMVLSILIAAGHHPQAPFETAAVLFGSVLAITLAKAFAELMANALDTGERITRLSWRKAWTHSAPTLAVANFPTLFFVLAGLGWFSADLASMLSQVTAVLLLAVLGGRAGWVIDRKASAAVLGSLFSGAIGLGLAVLKYLIH
ncbi:hypothetical protein MB818_01745 [Ruegeria sp. 1NDH52C]|uniref:VIT family protein n=1 Tax=Ruegeria alba TaxID=2916756 RepID=A0ABS9NRQ9_9RHOB|nr:hypothetical protein [Ruegeria alba]MCG6556906.1 hypothetical protein [Ruegeria alba]